MREKALHVLKIDPEFQSLIRPLHKKELFQLEENLLADGCIDPIIAWNNTIIDGHNRYELCNRHGIPFHVVDMYFECREEAVAWICAHQLGRRNISEETRKYLIGTQYHASKIADRLKNTAGSNQHTQPAATAAAYMPDPLAKGPSGHVTAKAVAEENHISAGTVQKYAYYAKAVETIGEKAPELIGDILSGKIKISHENTLELSKMTPTQIRKTIAGLEESENGVINYKRVRAGLPQKRKVDPPSPPPTPQTPVRSIKDMPAFDPDAEITSLALTIPSWISTMKRAWRATDQSKTTAEARKRLSTELIRLRAQINNLLRNMKEK